MFLSPLSLLDFDTHQQVTHFSWVQNSHRDGGVDLLLFSLTLASSGVYTDAAQGTLGSFDIFDEAKATYSLGLTYSF